VPGLAGELGGGAQVRGGGVIAVQVDQGRGRQQRQPAALLDKRLCLAALRLRGLS
jgi:hypothetical protein